MKYLFCTLILVLSLSFAKAQCFIPVLDTASVVFGQPQQVTDSGYMQPVNFTVYCQGLGWPNFFSQTGTSFFIPNTMQVGQVQGYAITQVEAWINKNFPTH